MDNYYSVLFLDALGAQKKQDFFLPDMRTVRKEVQALGGTILTIRNKQHSWLDRQLLSRSYKVQFLRALLFYIEVGTSPGTSLEAVIASEKNPKIRVELEPAIEVIRRGGLFLEAFERIRMLDRVAMAMLRAGEKSGLADSLRSIVAYLETSNASWKRFMAIFGWLTVDLLASIGSVFGTQFTFLPWLEKEGIKTNDPAAAAAFKHSLEQAYLLNGIMLWGTVVVVTLLISLVVLYLSGVKSIQDKVDNALARIPVLRSFTIDSAIGNGFAILSHMVKNGVPFGTGTEIAARSAYAPSVVAFWNQVTARLQSGQSIARAMSSKIVTNTEMMVIAAHQDGQQLSRILASIAESRLESAKRSSNSLIKWAFWISVAYMMASALIGVWVYTIHDTSISAAMTSVGGGI